MSCRQMLLLTKMFRFSETLEIIRSCFSYRLNMKQTSNILFLVCCHVYYGKTFNNLGSYGRGGGRLRRRGREGRVKCQSICNLDCSMLLTFHAEVESVFISALINAKSQSRMEFSIHSCFFAWFSVKVLFPFLHCKLSHLPYLKV